MVMLITFFIFSPSRCGVQITYFGICLNISEFGLNIYLTQFIFAVIEFPTKTGAYLFIEKIGRRPGEMGALLSTGVCLLINLFLAEGNLQIWKQSLLFPALKSLTAVPCELFFSLEKWIVRTVVGVFGKALSEASCTIIYLYTAELYPTVLRSVINSNSIYNL